MNWDGKRVTLYTKHDTGGKLFLGSKNNRRPVFTLRSTGVPSTNPPSYVLTFDDGYMHPCWRSCSALVETGTVDPPSIQGLCALVEGDDVHIQKVYTDALQNLLSDLQTAHPTSDIDYKRLEGVMQVSDDNGTRLDRVRIVCLTKAVPVDNCPNDDLVVIALSTSGGGLAENGGASGPPH